jgi:excinuclease ABC subunit C
MEKAAKNLDYELAAKLRDQIIILKNLQKKQVIIDPNASADIDVLGVARVNDYSCVHLLCIRDGRILGSRQYYPKHQLGLSANSVEIINNFIMQHYLRSTDALQMPSEILLVELPEDCSIIEEAVTQKTGKKVKIKAVSRGEGLKWIEMANLSAKEALVSRLPEKVSSRIKLQSLGKVLDLMINRIECFDVSHTSGTATIASCVVYTEVGMAKKDYRLYTIKTAAASDDYAAMYEALTRHFQKSLAEKIALPDLLIIDGGKGQLRKAELVTQELNLSTIRIISIAKGKARKPGLETIYLNSTGDTVNIAADSAEMHLLQRIRDEAHRFAITKHRNKRAKMQLQSKLELINGIGKIKRQTLLNHFGGMQGLREASIEEIGNVPGFSSTLARRVYNALHEN